MMNRIAVVAWLCLLAVSGCESAPGRVAADEDGWHSADSDAAPMQARPVVSLLKRVQEGLYRDRRAETFWDEKISYADRLWDDAAKQTLEGYIPTQSGLDLQWRDLEFFKSGEFARCDVREIERPRKDRPAQRADVNWTGKCLFRKLAEGWRISGPFLGGIQRGKGSWAGILMYEVKFMERRTQESRQAGQPVPAWAADQESIRLLGEALALYEEGRRFPLLDMMMFLHSNNLILRRYAHGEIARVFGVDYGYSEDLEKPLEKKSPTWLRAWQDWARRTYPKGYESVSWP